MLFNKEQLEGFISTIRENIAMSEMLLAKNPNLENAEEIKGLLKQQKESLENYTEQLMQLENSKVGRPTIGITKKVSLTLSEEEWNWLDGQAEGNRSRFLRGLVSDAMRK